jgi:hypothetical protein
MSTVRAILVTVRARTVYAACGRLIRFCGQPLRNGEPCKRLYAYPNGFCSTHGDYSLGISKANRLTWFRDQYAHARDGGTIRDVKPLTPKQENFAQAVANGSSQADAYRGAFACKKSKPATVIQCASRLMANRNIRMRVQVLREARAEKALWTRVKSVTALIEALTRAQAAGNLMEVIRAVRALNAMHGFNRPLKTQTPHTIPTVSIRWQ